MLVAVAIEQMQLVPRLHPPHLGMPRRGLRQIELVALDQGAVYMQADGHVQSWCEFKLRLRGWR
jgi:hypothetical protein